MPVAVPSLICDIHPSLSTEHSGSHTYYDISHLKNRRTLTSHFLTKHHVFRKTEPCLHVVTIPALLNPLPCSHGSTKLSLLSHQGPAWCRSRWSVLSPHTLLLSASDRRASVPQKNRPSSLNSQDTPLLWSPACCFNPLTSPILQPSVTQGPHQEPPDLELQTCLLGNHLRLEACQELHNSPGSEFIKFFPLFLPTSVSAQYITRPAGSGTKS